MTSIVNTNMNSLVAQNNLNTNQASLATAMQRLSSGLRINSAKDDAAGLAISQRMTAQINGSNQAARNANDGISLAQTAEGALAQIGTNLQRMRELAVQSANGTNSASDRVALNNEVQALSQEINRVAQSASFNGVNLLDGSFTAQRFQVGANATSNDSITVNSIASAQTSALGGVGTTYAATTTGTATTTALSAGDLTLNGQQVVASTLGAGPGQSAASAYSIAGAINSTVGTGVTALANSNAVVGAAASVYTSVAANTFGINGIAIGAVAAGGNAAGQGANLAAAINAVATQTGVTASANAATGAVTLTAADGRDVNIQLTGTAATGAAATTNKASFLANTGLAVASAAATTAGTAIAAGAFLTPPLAGGTLAAGTLTVNGVSVGAVAFGTGTYAGAGGVTIGGAAATITLGATVPPAGTVYSLAVTGTAKANGNMSFTTTGTAAGDATALAAALNALGAGGTNGTFAASGGTVTDTAGTLGLAVNSVQTPGGNVQTNAATAAIATANATYFAIGGGGVIGTQASNGAAYSAQQFSYALNTALAAASGGAGTNGSVTFNAASGAMTFVVGSNSTMQLALGGTAATAAAAANNQTATISQSGLTAGQLGTQAYAAGGAENHGTITLSSTNASGIVWAGAAATSAGLGATGTAAASVASSVTSIASMDVLTAADATAALSTIDGALGSVNASRASLGAIQNRFTSVVSSLQTTAQNLTASVSRIQDADFAAETASLSRAQILQQAGTAMVAQANQGPQGVLALLR